MKLYIARHGIARNVGEAGIFSDADRTLSPEGLTKTRQAARGLKTLGVSFDLVGTSPYPRARQTAEIFAAEVGGGPAIETCPFLACGAVTTDVLTWLASKREDAVLITGHMPDVADITAALIAPSEHVWLVFKKAAVACVSFEERPAAGAGCLEWMMQPRQLRRLAGVE